MARRALHLLAAVALINSAVLYAQHAAHRGQTAGQATAASPSQEKPAAKVTDEQKIKSAMRAAPAEIAKNATIMDHPDAAGGQARQLRAGTNGWVCFPTTPATMGGASGEDPMCLDKEWQKWADGWMNKKDPGVASTGIAYMLAGDKGASNTDPYASGPTPTNQWVVTPAHIMVLFPDSKALDAYPTDPKNGGPWVMWKGTPYAHLMVPVAPTKGAVVK